MLLVSFNLTKVLFESSLRHVTTLKILKRVCRLFESYKARMIPLRIEEIWFKKYIYWLYHEGDIIRNRRNIYEEGKEMCQNKYSCMFFSLLV